MSAFFTRSEALLGADAMTRLAAAHILIVGIGGVGSWCAEALVRTGVGHLTLVDDDLVAESNVNRQCPATARTVGRAKVEAMAERLREINPSVAVTTLCERYPAEGGTPLLGLQPNAVVDAIDSVPNKARLILDAQAVGTDVFSSMGAALRTDPTRVRLSRFEKVCGDGLARALRERFRKIGERPKSFTCVWSEENPRPAPNGVPKGSVMPVTATFGLFLAAEVVRRLSAAHDPNKER